MPVTHDHLAALRCHGDTRYLLFFPVLLQLKKTTAQLEETVRNRERQLETKMESLRSTMAVSNEVRTDMLKRWSKTVKLRLAAALKYLVLFNCSTFNIQSCERDR